MGSDDRKKKTGDQPREQAGVVTVVMGIGIEAGLDSTWLNKDFNSNGYQRYDQH